MILVAGMIPLSTAMQETGAAAKLADVLVRVVGDAGPHALLLGLFLLTAILGQLISNTATALIVIPVAVSAAADMDVSAKPVLMSVTVAAAASFLTPVATPANLMVMGPGGYRFGDYWKLGLPLLVLFGVVATLLVPVCLVVLSASSSPPGTCRLRWRCQTLVDEAHERFRGNDDGVNSDVYPALAAAPSDLFGICVVGDGRARSTPPATPRTSSRS